LNIHDRGLSSVFLLIFHYRRVALKRGRDAAKSRMERPFVGRPLRAIDKIRNISLQAIQ
jgi:hypothetical protein